MATIRKLAKELSYQPLPLYRDNSKSKTLKPCFKLDLNILCIKRPTDTFFIQVHNPHLLAWGIELGDILVVETITNNNSLLLEDLIVIEQAGEYKIYQFFNEITNSNNISEKILFSLDVREPNLRLQSWEEVKIAGVVTNRLHQMRSRTGPNTVQYAA